MTQATSSVLLEGFHAVKHAVRFGAIIQELYSTDEGLVLELAAKLAPDLLPWFEARLTPVSTGDARFLVPKMPHTKVIALAQRPSPPLLSDCTPGLPVVALEDPRNRGNVGACVRVSAGLGAGGLFTTGGGDPWHPTAIRGAAGLHFAVPVGATSVGEVADTDRYKVAFDAGGVGLHEVQIPDHSLLVFGTERLGVSDAMRAACNVIASLPMQESVSSYNLATSVAMATYAWHTRRGVD